MPLVVWYTALHCHPAIYIKWDVKWCRHWSKTTESNILKWCTKTDLIICICLEPKWIQTLFTMNCCEIIPRTSLVLLQVRNCAININVHLRERQMKIWMHENKRAFQICTLQPPMSLRVQEIGFRIVYCYTQMRKMMSSATMTWLSSCMRAKAVRTSGSVKRVWRPLLMSSIRVFIFTDCAWADWNTANSEDLNSFSLLEQSSRDVVRLHVSVWSLSASYKGVILWQLNFHLNPGAWRTKD